jgi:hypothetical protein
VPLDLMLLSLLDRQLADLIPLLCCQDPFSSPYRLSIQILCSSKKCCSAACIQKLALKQYCIKYILATAHELYIRNKTHIKGTVSRDRGQDNNK